MVDSYPMTSRVLDIAHPSSMMLSIFGPREFNNAALKLVSTELWLLDTTLSTMSQFASELRYGPYRQVGTAEAIQSAMHGHVMVDGTQTIAFGRVSIPGFGLRANHVAGVLSYKAELANPVNIAMNCLVDVGNADGSLVSRELLRASVSPLVLSIALTKLPSACYNAMGSMLREIGASLYKGKADLTQLSSIERAALMRLQDDRLKNLAEKAALVVVSDGDGIAHGAAVVEAVKFAEDWAMKLLRMMTPTIYAWIFSGAAPGEKAYKVAAV